MKLSRVLLATIFLSCILSDSAIASNDNSNQVRDIFGTVVDRTIIAGIMIGDNETTGESEDMKQLVNPKTAIGPSQRSAIQDVVKLLATKLKKQLTQSHFVSMTENVLAKILRTTGLQLWVQRRLRAALRALLTIWFPRHSEISLRPLDKAWSTSVLGFGSVHLFGSQSRWPHGCHHRSVQLSWLQQQRHTN